MVRKVLILSSFLLLSACGNLDLTLPSGTVDFLKTEIIVGGTNLADGNSQMLVVVHLKNSNNSPVKNYKPTYNITPSNGLITSECSTSTDNGISVCVLRSTSAGPKSFKLTNAKVGLEKIVEFEHPKRGQMLGLASGAHQNMTTGAGHKVRLSVGGIGTGVNATTSGGYKVSLTLKTALDSQ
ncbi:MAG: hypothetical protein A4S09_12815 [Proteobacteria bacterium SG_bin7]|nr:MAG: hypothetical protein A4S09_12815 [Proteobacteria bacterium SG_bin7]